MEKEKRERNQLNVFFFFLNAISNAIVYRSTKFVDTVK